MHNKTDKEKKVRYGLASAWSRIAARLIDFVFVYAVITGFVFLILMTDPNVKNFDDFKNLNISETWRYFIVTLISFFVMFTYFVLLSFWWHGKTIGKWIFKLQTWNLISTKSFFYNLIKKEFFIWIIIGLLNLILGVILALNTTENAKEILNQLIGAQTSTENFGITLFFQAFYYGYGVVLLILVVYMIIKDKKRCFQDKISDTVVIKLVDIHSKDSNTNNNAKTNKKITKNFRLPGEVKQEAIDEIDSL